MTRATRSRAERDSHIEFSSAVSTVGASAVETSSAETPPSGKSRSGSGVGSTPFFWVFTAGSSPWKLFRGSSSTLGRFSAGGAASP